MISVIIPCYNGSATLVATIESVLAQTCLDKEIIVVDDGSTDRSAQIIETFGNAIIAEFGPNEGVSAARNRGTKLARGNYVQYVDADDVLVPDTLARRVEALEGTGADIAYTDWQEFTSETDGSAGSTDVIVRPLDSLEIDAEAACASSAFWAPPAAVLYRRWVIDAIGGWNARLPIIQDARFLFDAARVGAQFTRVEGVGALYRVSADSLSRRAPEKFIRDCFVNATEIHAIWQKDGQLSKARREALIHVWSYLAISTFRANLPEFHGALQLLRSVSDRPHLDLRLRMLLSHILGQSAVNGAEQRIRTLLRPARRLLRRATNNT